MATIRTQILAAFLARVQSITIANGYGSLLGKVVMTNSDTETEALFPGEALACVIRDRGGQELAGMAGENFGTIEVEISVFCADPVQATADELCRSAHADLLAAIGTDKTFGGLCDDTVTAGADFVTVQKAKSAITITQKAVINYRAQRWNLNALPA
jgi:hypothetical protein